MKYSEWKEGYFKKLNEIKSKFHKEIFEKLESLYDEESLTNHLVEDAKVLEKFLNEVLSPIQTEDHEKFKQALQQSSKQNILPKTKVKYDVESAEPRKLQEDLKLAKQESKADPNMLPAQQIAAHVSSKPLLRLSGWTYRKKLRQFGDKEWIKDSYSSVTPGEEEKFFAGISSAYKPPMASIQSIMEAKAPKPKTTLQVGQPTYSILLHSDALQNHNFAVFKDAVMIMASQGNCLESTSKEVALLSAYPFDKTQGPASAMSAVDATIARRIFKDDCDMMQAWLNKYDSEHKHFHYKNGYLIPQAGQVTKCYQLLNDHGKEILINIQQVRIDNAGENDDQWMTQIPCFAMSLGGYDLFSKQRTTQDAQYMPGLCQKLLELQYQAAAKLAVLKSEQLGKRIPLVLTPVGGGVFRNSQKAIANAIQSIASIVKNANVDVVLSAYDRSEAILYRANISFLKNAPEISHQQMSTKKTGELIRDESSESCVIS